MDRLHYFLGVDHPSRNRASLVSMGIGFLWGMFSEKVMGCSFQSAAYQTVGIVGFVYLFEIWRYCAAAGEQRQRVRFGSLAVTRRWVWGFSSIAVLALLNTIPVSILEGAALDRRLRRLTQNVPIDRAALQQITQILKHAHAYKVNLPPATIAKVQSASEKTSQVAPALAVDAIEAGSAAASSATVNIGLPADMRGPAFSSLPEAIGSKWAFAPIATNTGPNNYATIGMAREPDVAKMERLDSPLSVASEYGPAFLLVRDLTATLDGYHLKHVVFQDMRLAYNGRPMILEDVYFFRCQFECRPDQSSWKLIAAVVAGGWVSLRLQ